MNLFAGASSLLASRVAAERANVRISSDFCGVHPLQGAGYFLFSGVSGFGDWNEVIRGLPHQVALRIGMTVFGAVMYFLAVWLLAVSVRPFLPDRRTYNIVGRLPYCAAALFSCAAGALDPLGINFSWSQPFRRRSVDRRASCGPTVYARRRRGGHYWCVVRSRGGLPRPYLEACDALLVQVYSSPCSRLGG